MRRQLFILIVVLFIILFPVLEVEADNNKIYRIEIKGEIDPGLASFAERGLAQAEEDGAEAIILEIDTFGGLVGSAIRIRDAVLGSGLRTITFVNGRAWSAGALIALAGEELVMVPGASIGAAETRPREEKYISALRKEFRSTAEMRGRNPRAAEAMVDADLEIESLSPAGKLLTLTTEEAITTGIANFEISSLSELLSELNLSGKQLITVEFTPVERLARAVTNPLVSGVLLTVGFIALVFEALVPGWGLGGTVGTLALSLFFSGYIINGLASWGLVVLFVAGIVLIMLEIFVVPGFGVTGIGGLIAIFSSLYFVFPTPGIALSVLAVVLLLSVLGTVLIIKFFGTSRFWKNISLSESQTRESGFVAHLSKRELEGKRGKTITPLRPAGTALIDDQRLDVVSQGGFIEKGREIEVIRSAGSKVIVKEIKKEDY